jgi:hypothetical protein
MVAADVGITVGFIATLVGTTGTAGTMAADEQAANNIRLQLITTICFNMVASPGRHPEAAFVICVSHASQWFKENSPAPGEFFWSMKLVIRRIDETPSRNVPSFTAETFSRLCRT